LHLFREETPIESYEINGRTVYVKREDLFGIFPAPPLAKLRGIRALLRRLRAENVRFVGCWDTRVSKLGQGVAAVCALFPGMRCLVSYPTKRGESTPEAITVAKALGAEILPVPGNRINICYGKVRRVVESRGGVMLPFGLECPEAVDAVRQVAQQTPREYLGGGTLVLSCGSGVTLAGLLLGLPVFPARIVALSAGRSLIKLTQCLRRHGAVTPRIVEFHEAQVPYARKLNDPCPFPTHPNYDLKAWKFLTEHVDQYSDPVLFWNIGA
jgi:1-aminocyclopropane-1-carboxylate deaminase/D-cysteine desulfhydrase-like pyridoxal-dependent ACC family enzyme